MTRVCSLLNFNNDWMVFQVLIVLWSQRLQRRPRRPQVSSGSELKTSQNWRTAGTQACGRRSSWIGSRTRDRENVKKGFVLASWKVFETWPWQSWPGLKVEVWWLGSVLNVLEVRKRGQCTFPDRRRVRETRGPSIEAGKNDQNLDRFWFLPLCCFGLLRIQPSSFFDERRIEPRLEPLRPELEVWHLQSCSPWYRCFCKIFQFADLLVTIGNHYNVSFPKSYKGNSKRN